MFGLLQVPFWGGVAYFRKTKGTRHLAYKPSDKWRPADNTKAAEWTLFKKDALERRRKEANTKGHSYLRQRIYTILGKYR